MADSVTGATEVATTAIEAAKEALEALAVEQVAEDSSPETAPPDVQAGLDSGARQAVERYRTTSRWVLGAFAAVGVLVFGSLPFTDVSKDGGNTPLIVVGLIMAAVGITAAIWAESRVAEPEDASLGELKTDLPNAPAQLRWWTLPPKRALYKLKEELGGESGSNHVGPMYPGVTPGTDAVGRIGGLIESIGHAQQARYDKAPEVAEKAIARDASAVALVARSNELKAAWDGWVKTVELAKPASPPGEASRT